jgi:putative OPT family oligopeptide transporter
VVLGAANAYLGLKAGQTIAATYPAAVIGMAVLRIFKGSILEENIARTAGSIGESVAAGAIFTIPAFYLVKAWPAFDGPGVYWKSTALMLVGSVLGVLFVSLIRRVMVEDPELPFPESVAASEVHKAGQSGAKAAKYLFYNIGIGASVYLGGAFGLYAPDQNFFFNVGTLGRSTLRLGPIGSPQVLTAGGVSTVAGATVSPAFLGVGYIIGPELASLNFSGSVIAWGLLIPLLIFFLGPQLRTYLPPEAKPELGLGTAVWRFIVRPIAVGSMMVGTCYTLFRMRKNLGAGWRRLSPNCAAGNRLRNGGPHGTYMSRKRVRDDRRDVPADVRAVHL